MQIFTSYYAKIKQLKKQGFNDFIAVSEYIPDFYKKKMEMDNRYRRIIESSPKKEWFFNWKKGKFDNNKYVELYYETVLNKLNFDNILNQDFVPYMGR